MIPKEIKIFVWGGLVVAVHGILKGYKPIVIDYDIDTVDKQDLRKYKGEDCFIYTVREWAKARALKARGKSENKVGFLDNLKQKQSK